MNFLSMASGPSGHFGISLRANTLHPSFDIYSVGNDGRASRVNRKAFSSKASADNAALKMAAEGEHRATA